MIGSVVYLNASSCSVENFDLFLVASAGYFCQVEPYGLYAGGQFGWEWQISEWGVRFTYGVGSLCFVGGALVSFPELLSDI